MIRFLDEDQIFFINKDIDQKNIQKTPDGFKYVNVSVIIDLLNKIFGYGWSWKIKDQGISAATQYNKDPKKQVVGSYAWVKGELSVPMKDKDGDIFIVSKEAFGGKQLVGSSKVQSQVFKSASSDALKKAASLLGIAQNVYSSEDVLSNIQEDRENEDSWTEIELANHKGAIDKIRYYKELIGEEKLEEYKVKFCNEVGKFTVFGFISPSNIDEFLKYMSAVVENKNTEQKKPTINPFPFDLK